MIRKNERPGVILAAGLGTRMNCIGIKSGPKPLTTVCGISLLMRTIGSLELTGSQEIIIVLGYQAGRIKKQIVSLHRGTARLQFVVNEKYELQNGVSVLCSRPFISDDFILTMADHVFDDEIMHLVKHHHPPDGGATLCVDYKLESIFDMEDATKVMEKDGYVQKIGKNLTTYNCIDAGIFIATKGLMEAIKKVYDQNGDASLSEGVQFLAHKGRMAALDIKEAFWQDVDTYEMLAHAENLLRTDNKNIETVCRDHRLRFRNESKSL
jgi:choline kinase